MPLSLEAYKERQTERKQGVRGRDRERDRDRETERQRDRERESNVINSE